MSRWYSKISQNMDTVVDAIEYYENEYLNAKKELAVTGKRIDTVAKELPGLVEYRYGQLQEIEAILSLLERKELKIKIEKKRYYLEHYNKVLSDKVADQYAEIHDDVVAMKELIEQFALVRNSFLSITKGFEYLHFQLSNITKLRVAGVEDAVL